jgi:hypothetical protein
MTSNLDFAQENTANLDTIRAPWMKPHEYILIKAEMDTEDNIAIMNRLSKVSVGASGQQEVSLNLGDVMLAKLECMVKGWNLTKTVPLPGGGTNEVPIPFDRAMIRKLASKYTQFMDREISKRNPDPDAEEQNSFLTSAAASTAENRSETASASRPK